MADLALQESQKFVLTQNSSDRKIRKFPHCENLTEITMMITRQFNKNFVQYSLGWPNVPKV